MQIQYNALLSILRYCTNLTITEKKIIMIYTLIKIRQVNCVYVHLFY